MFAFHLFIINTGKRGGRGARIKMHTDVFEDSQAERLLHFSYNSYTGNKKTKKKKRRKEKKKGGSIILASMLWSQNTDTYSFVCFRLCFHLLICSWSKSQSYYALTSCVSQYRKKGRFVVVLSSHLRCSPFKRGTDSLINYVTVNEWAGGLKRSGVPPVPPSPRIPPCTPFNTQQLRPITPFVSMFCSTVVAALSSGRDCSF